MGNKNEGVVEFTSTFTMSSSADKWTFFKIFGTDSAKTINNEVFGLRTLGGVIKYRLDAGSEQDAQTSIKYADNTSYQLYVKYDFSTSKLSIEINGQVIVSELAISFNSIGDFRFVTSDSNYRTFSIDNIAVNYTESTVEEYKTMMMDRFQAILATYDASKYTKNLDNFNTAKRYGATISRSETKEQIKSNYDSAISGLADMIEDDNIVVTGTAYVDALKTTITTKYSFTETQSQTELNNYIDTILGNINNEQYLTYSSLKTLDSNAVEFAESHNDTVYRQAASGIAGSDISEYRQTEIEALNNNADTQDEYNEIITLRNNTLTTLSNYNYIVTTISTINELVTDYQTKVDQMITAATETASDAYNKCSSNFDSYKTSSKAKIDELSNLDDTSKNNYKDNITYTMFAAQTNFNDAKTVYSYYNQMIEKIDFQVAKATKVDELYSHKVTFEYEAANTEYNTQIATLVSAMDAVTTEEALTTAYNDALASISKGGSAYNSAYQVELDNRASINFNAYTENSTKITADYTSYTSEVNHKTMSNSLSTYWPFDNLTGDNYKINKAGYLTSGSTSFTMTFVTTVDNAEVLLYYTSCNAGRYFKVSNGKASTDIDYFYGEYDQSKAVKTGNYSILTIKLGKAGTYSFVSATNASDGKIEQKISKIEVINPVSILGKVDSISATVSTLTQNATPENLVNSVKAKVYYDSNNDNKIDSTDKYEEVELTSSQYKVELFDETNTSVGTVSDTTKDHKLVITYKTGDDTYDTTKYGSYTVTIKGIPADTTPTE